MTIHVWVNGKAEELHGPIKGMVDWLVKDGTKWVELMGKGHVTFDFAPNSVVPSIRKMFDRVEIQES